jgi:fibronectin-binding autotransporter adhesin
MSVKRHYRGRKSLALIAAAAGAFLMPHASTGSPLFWSLGSGTGTWDTTTSNWSSSPNGNPQNTWTNGSTAFFSASDVFAGTYTVALVNNSTILTNGLFFDNGNVTINPGSNSNLQILGGTVGVSGGLTATINQAISGNDSISMSDVGTLVLGGANNYAGGTNVNSGTLQAISNSAFGLGGIQVGPVGNLLVSAPSAGVSGNVTNNGNFTIDFGDSLALNSSSTFSQNSNSLNINGSLVVTGQFNDNGGSINGTVTLDNSSGSVPTLNIGPSAGLSNILMTGSGTGWKLATNTIPNSVFLTVTPTNFNTGPLVPTSSGTLLCAGTITLNGKSFLGGGLALQSTSDTLFNAGTLNVNTDGTPSTGSLTGFLLNFGTVNVGAIEASFNGNVLNAGSFTINSGASFNFTNNTYTFTQNGNLTVNGSMNLNGNTFDDEGGFMSGAVTLDNSGGVAPTLIIGANATNGNFILTGTSGSAGWNLSASDIPAGFNLAVSSSSSATAAPLLAPNNLINAGTITLAGVSGTGGGLSLGSTSNTLTNTGSILFNTSGTSSFGSLFAALNNSGSIFVGAAGKFFGNITNTGSFTINNGASFAFGNNSYSFTQSGGNLTVNGSMTLTGNTFNDNGGNITGTVTLANSGGVAPTLGIGPGATSGNFLMTGTSASAGWNLSTTNIPSGISLNVTPTSSGTAAPLTVSNSLTNAGSITLNGVSGTGGGLSLGSTNNTLTNTGSIAINTSGTSSFGSLFGALNNSGAIAITAQSKFFGNVANSGLISIASGASFGFGNSSYNFTQSAGGILNIAGAMTLTGNTVNGTGAAINLSGSLGVNSPLNSSGSITISSSGVLTLNSSITNSGTFTLNSGGALIFANNTNSFTQTSGGILNVNGTMTAPGTTTNGTGATINIGGTLSLTGALTSTGNINIVKNGLLDISGPSGTLSSSTPVVVGQGGIFFVDNFGGNSILPAGRVSDTTNTQLNAASFYYYGASNVASTETVGSLTAVTGGNTVGFLAGSGGGTTSLTFSGGLNTAGRLAGATLNIAAANLGSTNKLFFTGQSTGFINGGTTVDNGAGGDANFAKYDSTAGVVPMATADYTTSFASSGHVRLTGPITSTLTAAASIATLSLDNRNGSVVVVQSGKSITLNQGGLLSLGSNTGTIGGGTIKSGRADGEIDAYTQSGNTLQLNSQIVDNGTVPTSLVKSGAGTLILGNGPSDTTSNTYTGSTYVHQGILELNKAPGSFAISGIGISQIVVDGGTLVQEQANQIDPRIGVAVNTGGAVFNGSQTLPSVSLVNGTANTNAGTVVTIGAVVSGGIVPLTSTTVLTVNSSTLRATGSTLIVNSSSIFTGASPTVQLDAGATSTAAGLSGGPALLQLHGNITAAISSGVGGIVTGTVAAGQSAGVLDLGGMRSIAVSSGIFMMSATVTDGGLTVGGSGTVELTSSNNYSLGTVLNAGTLIVGNPQGLGAPSTAGVPNAVSFAGGALELQSDSAIVSVPQQVSSTPTGSISIDVEPVQNTTAGSFTMSTAALGAALNVTGSAGGSLTFGNVSLQSVLPIVANTNQTSFHIGINTIINGIVSNASGSTNGDILKDGAGTLTFSGTTPNTYLGTTYVSGGTLALNKSANVDAVPHDLDVFSGGTVQLMTTGQIDPSAHIILNAASSPATLNLNGFNNTIGNGAGAFLSFVAGGTLATGAGKATLGGDVQFTGTSGSATISGNLGLGAAGRIFTLARGSSTFDMQISAAISGGPASGTSLTKAGPGILDLTGVNTYSGDTVVNQGTLILDYNGTLTGVNITATGGSATINGSIPAAANLTVNNSGIAKFGAGQGNGILFRTLAAINLSSNGQVIVADPINNNHLNRSALVVSALNITNSGATWQGRVNLSSNDLIVHNGNVANISSQLKSGFNSSSGYWNGTGGIISTTAASDSTHLTTLGFRTGGNPVDGINTTASDVIVKYTYFGDADLNGTLDGADYQQIDTGFGLHLTGWSNGDFNYDGVIDGTDFSLIDNTFNQLRARASSPLVLLASPMASPASAVPEPSCLVLLIIAATGSLTSRRRRSSPNLPALGIN